MLNGSCHTPSPPGPSILWFLGDQMLMRWYVSAGTSLLITHKPHLSGVGMQCSVCNLTVWIASAKKEHETTTTKKTNSTTPKKNTKWFEHLQLPPENLFFLLFLFVLFMKPNTIPQGKSAEILLQIVKQQIIVSLAINQQLLWDLAHKHCHDTKLKLDANCFWKNGDACQQDLPHSINLSTSWKNICFCTQL